ncbi:hypothetical protein [Mycolicibacterium palauense]|uniref:hypothetical protein n=1 Tax=Mycolicibacterium palauense TaxID=2034511 RepID=UPI001C3F4A9D|nr:hypothetical protein [Mycolicibacterium palauense]
MSDELIRAGAHDDVLGSDGLVVMAYLLSCASAPGAKKVWETSAAEISEKFGWGRNRERASKALARAVKDGRLLIREYLRDGALVPRRRAYVVCAGGRRFTDEERLEQSAPIELASKAGIA